MISLSRKISHIIYALAPELNSQSFPDQSMTLSQSHTKTRPFGMNTPPADMMQCFDLYKNALKSWKGPSCSCMFFVNFKPCIKFYSFLFLFLVFTHPSTSTTTKQSKNFLKNIIYIVDTSCRYLMKLITYIYLTDMACSKTWTANNAMNVLSQASCWCINVLYRQHSEKHTKIIRITASPWIFSVEVTFCNGQNFYIVMSWIDSIMFLK